MTGNDPRPREDAYPFQRAGAYAQASAPPVSSAAGSHGAPTAWGEQSMTLRGSRRAHLRVSRISPWSVTKFGFVVALVCFIVFFVAVAILYGILAAMGVFDAVESMVVDFTRTQTGWFTASRVLGYTAFVGAINVVLITLLATLGAYAYNLVADLVGGVEVTLTERE